MPNCLYLLIDETREDHEGGVDTILDGRWIPADILQDTCRPAGYLLHSLNPTAQTIPCLILSHSAIADSVVKSLQSWKTLRVSLRVYIETTYLVVA